ncbi:MAG: glycosyltransferase family 2 protein, partial [Chloroflexi bacterium]|nr:glycosyltransferase family 2 protein [Chloroflexota bacterium]
MTSDIRLSVVIPTHNRRDLLQEMLTAFREQTLPASDFEVVVVIDGSTDDTLDMVHASEQPFELRAVFQEQSGVAVARNRGAKEARGNVVLFLDDDIMPHAQLLEEHLRMQTDNPPGVVLGRLIPADTGKRSGWNVWEDAVLSNHYEAVADGRRPPAGRRLYSGNFSASRKAFLAVGGFNEELRRGEDVELGFRFEREGVPFYFNHDASAIHRGYRTFESWCSSAHAYGHCDVLLATKMGSLRVLPEMFGWYRNRGIVIRTIVQMSLGRKALQRLMVGALKLAAELSDILGT